jgi:hypothetical protein
MFLADSTLGDHRRENITLRISGCCVGGVSNTGYMKAASSQHCRRLYQSVQLVTPSSREVLRDSEANDIRKGRYVFMHRGIIKTPTLWTYLTRFAGQIASWYFYVYLQAGIYNSGNYILITKLIKVSAYAEDFYLHILYFYGFKFAYSCNNLLFCI